MVEKKYRSVLAAALICVSFLLLIAGCTGSTVLSQDNANKRRQSSKVAPGVKGKKMDTVLNYPTVDKITAFKQLDSYIFDIHYGRKSEPKNLDPAHVEEFIREKIDRSKEPQSFERARNVVDIYDLAAVIDHFDKLLDRSEKDERAVLQSIQSVRLLAEQGDDPTERKAFDYYEYLVKHPASEPPYEPHVEAANSFTRHYSPATLQEVLKREYPKLKEKGKTDYYIDGVAEQVFSLLNGRLPQLVDQINARNSILNIGDLQERIAKLVAIYLGQDDLTSPELERWSAKQLRRLAREGQTEAIISVFRKAADSIKAGGYKEEEAESFLLRAARAVRFFGGELTPEEKALVDEGSEYQIDYLDRDFF
ncbi:MAG TPA: hypothetical protein VK918_04045 [Pyrinomonadaceae bacterium]|nr:hypothetical protein [Pyrinomonadaceae bacterium]